jgi:hypothetical protein
MGNLFVVVPKGTLGVREEMVQEPNAAVRSEKRKHTHAMIA